MNFGFQAFGKWGDAPGHVVHVPGESVVVIWCGDPVHTAHQVRLDVPYWLMFRHVVKNFWRIIFNR